MTTHLHLDAETFSATDIKHGLARYFADSQYQLLMLAWAVDNGAVHLWEPSKGPPPEGLRNTLHRPDVVIHAHNAVFEWHVLRKLLGYEIPIQYFRCTQVRAYSLGFTGSLANIQEQVGLDPDKQKLDTGKKLIHRFCKPAPSNHTYYRYYEGSHPQEWELFRQYCIQDVIAERALEVLLDKYPASPPVEVDYWNLDHKINQRGVRLDLPLIKAVQKLDRTHKALLRGELKALTGLKTPTSQGQFLDWLRTHHEWTTENVRKETLQKILETPCLDPTVWKACELRMEATKTSNAKWAKMEKSVSNDGRLRNLFQFLGAQRTGRWAGRLVQAQNLPASNYDSQEEYNAAVGSLMSGDLDLLEMVWGDISPLLSQSIRGAFIPDKGNSLVVCDYSSIESRVLGWLSGCKGINNIFEQGLDSYKDFASKMFHVGYKDVTKTQRKFAKPPVLGCGYQLGWRGLIKYAEGYGTEMTEDDAKTAVNTFRSAYHEVPTFWGNLMSAIELSIREPDTWRTVEGKLNIGCHGDMLAIQLPSGRFICYHEPDWRMVETPWGRDQMGFTYMGANQHTTGWERITAAGGKVTENIVQAIARDLQANGMLIMGRAGLDIVMHVHDETVVEAESSVAPATLEWMKQTMSATPPEYPGLLLSAAGWVGPRFRKD